MTIKCGKCKGRHATTDDVRRCYQGEAVANLEPAEQPTFISPGDAVNPASKAQGRYILDLQSERVLPAGYPMFRMDNLRSLERADANSKINLLKSFPIRGNRGENGQNKWEWDVPEGRFAIYVPGVDDEPGAYSYVDRQDLNPPSRGHWLFYEVSKGRKGTRWEGYTFCVRLQGAPGTYQKIKLPRDVAHKVMDQIAANVEEAMVNYGKQSGVCGRCSSPLTNQVSLDRGIGPKCASKLGW